MQSYLILSPVKKESETYAYELCKSENISPFDITILEVENALGISDVRALHKTLYLKPFKGAQKAFIIHNAQTATTETQNALLKVLEEPPAHTFILLTATEKNAFLPTVLSRCNIVTLTKNDLDISQTEVTEYFNDLQLLLSSGIGYKLQTAQNIAKEKETALEWIRNMLYTVRSVLFKSIDETNDIMGYVLLLNSLQQTYTIMHDTNVNARFLLEATFLSW